MSALYILATPIGNLEDITLRALRILREVDVIVCEDTRVTRKLLQKYGIETKTMSYHAQSTSVKTEQILRLLGEGKKFALVSDSGTPTISDPGVLLVREIRERFGGGVSVAPIPGPSALISALSTSGIPSSEFLFLGFLPHKKGRETLFREIAESQRTVVFYESVHRVLKTLERLAAILGTARRMVVARELTKIHEEIISGTGAEALAYFSEHSEKVRGEFVIIIEGS